MWFCEVEIVHRGNVKADLILLQAATIIKSLPKYMYCPAINNIYQLLNVLECNHQGQRNVCMAVSSVTRMNDCLDSPVSLIPSGLLYYRALTDE